MQMSRIDVIRSLSGISAERKEFVDFMVTSKIMALLIALILQRIQGLEQVPASARASC